VYRILAGKPEGKRPLGRTRRRRKDILVEKGQWHLVLLGAAYRGASRSVLLLTKCRIWAGHVARVGEKRGAHVVVMWQHTRLELLDRFRRGWEDHINTGLQKL
jgi:hypothetical protein